MKFLLVGIIAFLASVALAGEVEAPTPIMFPEAVDAIARYKSAIEAAWKAYVQASVAADQHEIAGLRKALADARKGETSVDELKAIDDATKAADQRMRRDAVATGVVGASSLVQDTADISGKIAFISKGDAVISLNSKEIGRSGNGEHLLIPVTIRKGDVITVRAQSPFVYRAFRIGFIPEHGLSLTFSNVKLMNGLPETIKPADVIAAPFAPGGAQDGGLNPFWNQIGLSDRDPVFGLPEKNREFVFCVLIN